MKSYNWLPTRVIAWIETITPSCKDMTDLLSQSMDRRLPLRDRLRIWFHLAICDRCARFAEQLAFIRNASRSIFKYAENISTARFPESAKERIKERIRQWLGAARH
jgi:hypothetical protein